MAEYEAYDLASGSDDEKRLEKAERETEKKALKRKRSAAGVSSYSSSARPIKSALGNVQQLSVAGAIPGAPSQQSSQGVRMQARVVHAVGPCFLWRAGTPQALMHHQVGIWPRKMVSW